MNRLHLKPCNPGASLRDPRSKVKLPAEGGLVPNSPYWRRRIADGDAVEIKAEKPAAKPKAKPKTTKAPKADKAEKPENEEG